MNSEDFPAPAHANVREQDGPVVISALFDHPDSARSAIYELRECGIQADNISVIARDEDRGDEPQISGAAGVSREKLQDEALTYRAAPELPADEELGTTTAAMTGRPQPQPLVTDYEVPPDEPYGGGTQLGLSRDSDMVRRNEAQTSADEDIYTDFPDRPGGINPQSPTAGRAGGVQQDLDNRTTAAQGAAVGAGLGGLAGLVGSLAALAVPGLGPIIAAGPLAAALGGALAGGAAGGIIGALSTIGVPDEYAREYAAAIEQGQTLVSVRADPLSAELVERVLTAHGGRNLH